MRVSRYILKTCVNAESVLIVNTMTIAMQASVTESMLILRIGSYHQYMTMAMQASVT